MAYVLTCAWCFFGAMLAVFRALEGGRSWSKSCRGGQVAKVCNLNMCALRSSRLLDAKLKVKLVAFQPYRYDRHAFFVTTSSITTRVEDIARVLSSCQAVVALGFLPSKIGPLFPPPTPLMGPPSAVSISHPSRRNSRSFDPYFTTSPSNMPIL